MACKAKLGNPTTAEAIMERLLSKDAAWRPDHLNRFPFAIEEDQEHYLKSLKAANVPEPAK